MGGRFAKRAIATLALSITLAASMPIPYAFAQDMSFSAHGRMRYRHVALTDFPLDDTGLSHGQRNRGLARLRVHPELTFSKGFFIRANIQLLDGQLYGDESDVGRRIVRRSWQREPVLEQLAIREIFIQLPIVIGVARLGRVQADWGLGIVANDGDEERWTFSDASHGDVVNRASVLIRPLMPFLRGRVADAVQLGLAVDLIDRDEITDFSRGDFGYQLAGFLRWAEPRVEAGFYAAKRDVERESGDRVDTVLGDVYVRWTERLGERLRLRLALETTILSGSARFVGFDEENDEVDIEQLAGVARLELSDRRLDLTGVIEAGLSSGPTVDEHGLVTAFGLDPSFKVGSILFEEVLGRVSARSYDRASEGGVGGVGPRGGTGLPSDGAVENASYVAIEARYTPCEGCFGAALGGLAAFTDQPLRDPSLTSDPNQPISPFGEENASGPLGYELNVAFHVAVPTVELLDLRLGAQYAIFTAGQVLADVGTVHKVRVLADLGW